MELQSETFLGENSAKSFNEWSSLHPDCEIQKVSTEVIKEGKLDGTVSIIILYGRPRKIIGVIGNVE